MILETKKRIYFLKKPPKIANWRYFTTKNYPYVQNCTPSRVLDNKTPKEDFLGEKSEVNHLRIFGFPVYIHIPKDKRNKLDPFGRKGIFVGYNDTSKAYRIYFPGFKKMTSAEM